VLRALNVDKPGTKRSFDGVPAWAYISAGEAAGKLGFPKKAELKSVAADLGATVKEVHDCLEAGEALRCRFLIPTTPTENLTPLTLSAPSVPGWLSPDAGLGASTDDVDGEETTEIGFLEQGEKDTAEIMAG
jgi:hypothetical protein